MRKLGSATLLLLLFSVAQPVRAGSIKYSVSINAQWTESTLCCLEQPWQDPSVANVVESFTAHFDVYANGSLVPGTMVFSNSGPYFAGGMYFGPPPPCLPSNPCSNAPYGTAPPYAWSENTDDSGYYVGFLPGTWPPSGSANWYADGGVELNCLPQNTLGCNLFGCANIGCATGDTTWATYGTVNIQQVSATPEPPSIILLGTTLVVAFAMWSRKTKLSASRPYRGPLRS